MSNNRTTKENSYLNIAQECAKRGTCLRRNYGAVIVNYDEIISTGYSGSPRHKPNCCDISKCLRQELGIHSGERYELCRSVHAEMNACIHASRREMLGAVMYLCGIDAKTKEIYKETKPCVLCARIIINSGIGRVIIRRTLEKFDVIYVDDLEI